MIDYDNFKKSLKNLEIRNQFRKDTVHYENEQLKESVEESVPTSSLNTDIKNESLLF